MSSRVRLSVWLLISLVLLSPLAACGPSPNEPGGLEGQVLAMLSASEQPVLLPGAVIAISGPAGSQTTQTDGQGRYRFAELRPGAYGFAASYSGELAGSTRLQAEERQFTVSPGQDETISTVLLAEGITPPPAPPPPPADSSGGSTAAGGPGGGLMTNPFFWYFLFNQPRSYGYARPPIIVGAPGGRGPIDVSREQPRQSSSGRRYTNYGEDGTAGVGTKPVPPITSRGVTRPGGGAGPSRNTQPAVRPPSGGSQGITRPGGSDNKPSIRPPTSRPPAIRPPRRGK